LSEKHSFHSQNSASILPRVKYRHPSIVLYAFCTVLEKLCHLPDCCYACINHFDTSYARRDGAWRSTSCRTHNNLSLGRAVAFFLGRWEEEKAHAGLAPRLLPRESVTITVSLNDGKTRQSEGHFYYLLVVNSGEEAANQVIPMVAAPREFRGLLDMRAIPQYFKSHMSVKSKLSSEDFDSERERFAEAILKDPNVAHLNFKVEGLGANAFALCFSLKDGNQFYIPTGGLYILDFPVNIVINAFSKARGLPRRGLGTYRCYGSNWHNLQVVPITS
jgi:hypothetical protein